MPQPSKEDPRMYVRGIPLPVPTQINYRDLYPVKIAKRKDNYFRRIEQMKSTGFNSAKHEPYRGIGDPFYLDEKKLVLHALGQWDESRDIESSSSSDEDDKLESASELGQNKTKLSAAKFVLRRSRKDLNTLSKEVSHGRSMIRNVRLGHGLFDLIEKEREKRQEVEHMQSQKKAEAMRNEWQPPKQESSSDEESSDDELKKEEELSSYLVEIGQNNTGLSSSDEEEYDDDDAEKTTTNSSENNQPPLVQLISRIPDDCSESLAQKSIVTTTPIPTKKKKTKLPRPYTPHHTNINESRDQTSRDSLFRQLCALNWILEAMKQDSLTNLPPIMSSWKLNDIGGWKTLETKQRLKEKESEWKDKIILGPSSKHLGKRTSRHQSKAAAKKNWGQTRNVLHPGTGYPNLTTPTTAMSSLRLSSTDNSLPDEIPPQSSGQDVADDEEDTAYKSIFKFLNDDDDGGKTDESPDRQDSPVHERRKKEKRSSELETKKKSGRHKSADLAKRLERESSIHRSGPSPRERMSSQTFRAELNVRPKSSPTLLKFVANRPSIRYGCKVNEWSNAFRELQEDKALTLHDILDNMERQRYTMCKNKFTIINMSTQGSSFHRAVEMMRLKSSEMFNQLTPEQLQQKKAQASEGKGNWYLNLKNNIPMELCNLWEYKNILSKLAKFGLNDNQSLLDKRRRIEGAGQQHSMLKFIKVLGTLREWEICSPDISAAVEFAREKIVSMSIEDFEAWFSTQFPKVVRPQTAPPRSEKKDEDENQRKTENKGRSSAASSRRPFSSATSRR